MCNKILLVTRDKELKELLGAVAAYLSIKDVEKVDVINF